MTNMEFLQSCTKEELCLVLSMIADVNEFPNLTDEYMKWLD